MTGGGTSNDLMFTVTATSTAATSTTATSTAGSYGHISRYLRRGSQGQDVAWLQEWLYDHGYYPQDLVTGYYGDLTQAAVQNFQAKNGIVSSGNPDTTGYGNVGPKTGDAINSWEGGGH